MSKGDWSVPPNSLTEPPFALPGQPRLLIGPNLPPPLNTYDFSAMLPIGSGPFTAEYAIIWYIGTPGDSYQYMAMVNNHPTTVAAIITGSVNGTSMVEASPGLPRGAAQLFGGEINETNFNHRFLGEVEMVSGSLLQVDSGATAQTIAGSILNTQGYVAINPQNQPVVFAGNNDFAIDTRSQGRGLVVRATSAANIAVTGGAIRFLSTGLTTYRNGRAFVGHLNAIWNASAAGITATLTLVNGVGTGITGTTRTPGLPLVASQEGLDFWFPFANRSGADQSTGMQAQGVASSGTVNLAGSAAYPATLDIYDVGTSGDYTDYPSF